MPFFSASLNLHGPFSSWIVTSSLVLSLTLHAPPFSCFRLISHKRIWFFFIVFFSAERLAPSDPNTSFIFVIIPKGDIVLWAAAVQTHCSYDHHQWSYWNQKHYSLKTEQTHFSIRLLHPNAPAEENVQKIMKRLSDKRYLPLEQPVLSQLCYRKAHKCGSLGSSCHTCFFNLLYLIGQYLFSLTTWLNEMHKDFLDCVGAYKIIAVDQWFSNVVSPWCYLCI